MNDARLFPVQTMAVTDWPSNGHLIESVVDLGYLKAGDVVLDVTYGRGLWWTRWRPTQLLTHDLAIDGVDFRALPEADESVDVVCFDPPHVPQGGSDDDDVDEFRDRYGLNGAPMNRHALTHLVLEGLDECARVVRRGGFVLVKVCPFQSGRRFHHMPTKVITRAEHIGLRFVDELVMRRNTGPTSTEVFHRARRNSSNLLVFDRRRRRPKRGTTGL